MKEKMKEKILGIFVCMLMIGSIFGSINTAKSGPSDDTDWVVIERGSNFIRRQNTTNTSIFSWESAPKWIYNGTAWVPYIFNETDDYYQVQSGLIGTRIYKDGYAEFWDPDMTEVRLYEERWILEYYDNDKWKVCDVYSPTFVVDSDDTSINITASFITDYPNSGERAFNVNYIFREGRPLKHEITFTSHSSEEHLFRVKQKWAGIVADKVKHSKGTDAITSPITVNSSWFKFQKDDGNLSIFENQWEMYYGYNETTHRYYILENHNLKPVEIDVHAQGLKADFVFGNWTLSQDESLEIDPDTATLDDPTEDGYILWNSMIESYDRVKDESYDILFGGESWIGYRGYVEWDISSLAGATLSANPVFRYISYYEDATDEEINPITEEPPSEATDANLYSYIGSGKSYVDPFDLEEGEVDLGASAKSDLQDAMGTSQSWFAIGFQSPADEGEFEEELYSSVCTEESGCPPTLYVEYTLDLTNLVKYYFDHYDNSEWDFPENMVDGSILTFADGWDDTQQNDGNTCPGDNLGTITRVDLRFHGYANYVDEPGPDDFIKLIPWFESTDLGDDHSEVLIINPYWSQWFDITTDTNAPSPWTWADVQNLGVHVLAGDGDAEESCSKVEIRITFNNAPAQSNQLIWNATTATEKTLNATDVDLYPTSFNVTINDADGDKMDITIMTNESGTWTVVNTGNDLSNGAYSFTNTSWVDTYNTKYWISFDLTDGTDWSNHTYHFTTTNAYEIVWDVEEDDSMFARKVATDTNNDVIAVGVANNLAGYIVKYDGIDGEILWEEEVTEAEANPNPRPLDPDVWVYLDSIDGFFNMEIEIASAVFMNVVVDSENNVIAAAQVIYEIIDFVPKSDVYVIKYDSDGNKLWDKLIDVGIYDLVIGITVDNNDNIYVSGTSLNGLPIPHLEGWVYKLGKNFGTTLWDKHTSAYGSLQPGYYEVVVNSYNKVFVVGTLFETEWDGDEGVELGRDMIVVKYDGTTGLKLDEEIIEYVHDSTGMAITVDDNDDVFICGDVHYSPSVREIIKYDSNFNKIWSLIDNDIFNIGQLRDIDIINVSNVVVTGQMGYDINFSTTVYDGATGTQLLLEIQEGFFWEPPNNQIDARAHGVAVDSNDDIITTGDRYHYMTSTDYFYTMKYHITKQL